MSELPGSWVLAGLLDVSELLRGVTYTKSDASDVPFDGSIPVLRANNIVDRKFDLSALVHVPDTLVSDAQRITKGDVVVATSSGSVSVVGKAAQAGTDMHAGFGAFCGLLRPSRSIEARYFGHFFSTEAYRSAISSMARGVNINNLKRDHFESLSLPLAPLNEQKRIATKLDAVLARVDTCRGRLDRVPAILKHFRQAVLAAATSGKLTEEWRVATEVAYHDVGDKPLAFPNCWAVHKVGDVFSLIDGDRGPNYPKQSDYLPAGHCLFLSTKNVRPFGFLFDETVFLTEEKHKTLRNGTLELGDVVITTRGTLGNVAVYDETVPYKIVRINSGMLILRNKGIEVINQFLKFYIASPLFFVQLNKKQSGSAQPQIPAGILKTFVIPLPPVEEQHEIVHRVEALFAYADRLEARYATARDQIERLTPALLAKAFCGELVPQDPNDEPASVLLERIHAARVVAGEKSPGKMRTERKRMTTKLTTDTLKEIIRGLPSDRFTLDDLRRQVSTDHETFEDMVFVLLSEARASVKQVFDAESQTMHLVRVKR